MRGQKGAHPSGGHPFIFKSPWDSFSSPCISACWGFQGTGACPINVLFYPEPTLLGKISSFLQEEIIGQRFLGHVRGDLSISHKYLLAQRGRAACLDPHSWSAPKVQTQLLASGLGPNRHSPPLWSFLRAGAASLPASASPPLNSSSKGTCCRAGGTGNPLGIEPTEILCPAL